MAILASDLRVFRAETNNDTPTNGGEISTTQSVSGVSGNVFPRVSLAERTAGLTRYRKAFHRVNNTGNNTLYDAQLLMFKHTPAEDAITVFATNFTEIQDDVAAIVGTKNHYGAGTLANPASSGALTIDVDPEQATHTVYRVGDRVYITDKDTYESVAGNEEFGVIDSVGAGPGGSTTIGLETQLLNSYAAGTTRVSSIMGFGDVAAVAQAISSTVAGSGALSMAGITVNQRGSLYDQITLTFTSATGFTASSAKVGSLGVGSTGTTFAPVNGAVSAAYFSIPSSAWSGVFANGDVVTFRTVPAAVGVWYVQHVPAGSPAFSGNSFTMLFGGETE